MASQESLQQHILSESGGYGSLEDNGPIVSLQADVSFESPQLNEVERKVSVGMSKLFNNILLVLVYVLVQFYEYNIIVI